jgi:hypothetical protein
VTIDTAEVCTTLAASVGHGGVGCSGVAATNLFSNVAEVVTSLRNRAVVYFSRHQERPLNRATNRPRDRHGGLES